MLPSINTLIIFKGTNWHKISNIIITFEINCQYGVGVEVEVGGGDEVGVGVRI